MTLGDFFNILTDNPAIILFYFIAVPLTAFLAMIFGRGMGHLSPWKYLYTALIYLTCVPGIFSFTLSAYLFLFESTSILGTNLYTQVLPIVSMIVTLWLIQKNASLEEIPGFDRLSGLLILIFVILTGMWILDRTRLIAFTFVPLIYVLLIMIGLFVLARFALRKAVQ